jgi:hypothetical protein
MATTKVSALSALTTTDGAEELLINDGGTSKKVTIDNVLHDNSIRAEHYVDGSIATAHIADNAITSAKLGVDVIVAEDIANNAITVAELADNAVTTAKLNADAVTGAKIADDAIDSEHYTDGSIDTAHIADDAVTAAKLANSINTEIAANTAKVTNATHTGDVTGATALTIAADAVTGAKIADDSIDSEHIVDGSIDTAHIGDDQVTAAKLANSINTDIATGVTANTTANNALPKAGGTMTGNISHASDFTIDVAGDLLLDADGGDIRMLDDTTDFIKFTKDGNNSAIKAQVSDGDLILRGSDNGAQINALTLDMSEAGKAAFNSGATFGASVTSTTDTDTSNTGSVTLDFAANQNFVLTLTGNVTLANPSTEQVGQSGFITFIQDGTGSRTVSLGTDYETAAGAGLTLTSTASATDIVPYVVVASGRILLGTPQLAFA